MFVVRMYKRLGELGCCPSFLSLPFHHNIHTQFDMSSPVAFPFSFKEDASAYDVVESMEQVGDLASLSLN